jgi:hypothetical protein
MKNRISEIVISIICCSVLAVLLYFLYTRFFSQYELNGFSLTKNFLIALGIAAGIAFVSIFPFMGLPGGIILFSISPLLGFSSKNTEGDKAWPAAILTSVIWPFCLPLSLIVKHYMLQSSYNQYANLGWIATTLGGMILTVGIVNIMGKKGL